MMQILEHMFLLARICAMLINNRAHRQVVVQMDLLNKVRILADAAKYDVSCSSSGSTRSNKSGGVGNAASAGICHSWSAAGRCISLLKILMTNICAYDCSYCINRSTSDVERAMLSPEEVAEITINFYRRNYIEGLFLSSAVFRSPDETTERMIRALEILRREYRFNGYIHVKVIPGTSPSLTTRLGFLADRVSVNIELPSPQSLHLLAPQKSSEAILGPMNQIHEQITESREKRLACVARQILCQPDRHAADCWCDSGGGSPDPPALREALSVFRAQAGLLFELYTDRQPSQSAVPFFCSTVAAWSTALPGRLASCVSMALLLARSSMIAILISASTWTPSQTGLCAISTSFLWRSIGHHMRCCCECPGSACVQPNES
jgi:hypothetical protein